MKDLHLHLSSAVHPILMFELICETGMKIKQRNFNEFLDSIRMEGKVHNLDEYLTLVHSLNESQSFPAAVEKSVYNAFINSHLKGCEYLELRWSPFKRSRNFAIDFDRLILAGISGMSKAKSYFGIDGGMIFCLGRDVSMAANEATLKKAIAYKDQKILGIDLAGPYIGKLPDYVGLYKDAKKAGLLTTIHAGETVYPELEADLELILTKIKPDRIGHGIQLIKFPKLLQLTSRLGIELEICITSNLMTKAVESLEEFKIIFNKLEEANIKYSINTDAIYPLRTNLQKEHELYEKIKKL